MSPLKASPAVNQIRENWQRMIWFVAQYSSYTVTEIGNMNVIKFFPLLDHCDQIYKSKLAASKNK